MTTGVDAQTCKLIVLDQQIQSMTEFKQIIGRGTRINEDFNKFFFTIIDFKQATRLFADPNFDGDPVQIYEPKDDGPILPPDPTDNGSDSLDGEKLEPEENGTDFGEGDTGGGDPKPIKRYVVGNVEVSIISERIQYFDADGKLITESLKDYTRKTLTKEFESLEDFLRRWSSADRKQAIIEELRKEGIFFEELAQEIGRDCDPFDLICHIVWDVPPLSRQERVREVKKRNYFTKYGEQAKRVLEALLDKYADEGIEPMEEPQILTIAPFNQIGTPVEIAKAFGGFEGYQKAVWELQRELYSA